MTGETPKISEHLELVLYDWVAYQTNAYLVDIIVVRWLGVYQKVEHIMKYCILIVSVRVISCVTVQGLTSSEMAT